MATDTISHQQRGEQIDDGLPDDLPELTDGERWSGTVVGSKSGTITWGTYEFAFRVQCFADDSGHVQIGAPSSPPPSAEPMLSDWLNGDHLEAAAAQILAEGWGIDITEVRS